MTLAVDVCRFWASFWLRTGIFLTALDDLLP